MFSYEPERTETEGIEDNNLNVINPVLSDFDEKDTHFDLNAP